MHTTTFTSPEAQPIDSLLTLLTWKPGALGQDELFCRGSVPLSEVGCLICMQLYCAATRCSDLGRATIGAYASELQHPSF